MVCEELRLAAHVRHLSSVANPFVKHVAKLRQSSAYRHASGFLPVIGDVPLRELCDIAPAKFGKKTFIEYLLVLESSNVGERLADFAERLVAVTPGVMHKLSGVHSSEGCHAVGVTAIPSSFCALDSSRDPSADLTSWCPCPQRLLALDGIQDPGNLGTLVRTAAAFDWDGVFLLDGCCDPFNEKAVRASRGACFWIPIACGQWNHLEALTNKKRMKLFAGEPQHKTKNFPFREKDGEGAKDEQVCIPLHTVANFPRDSSLCLVLGSEGQGLSEEVRVACSLISIPMPSKFESLNVAVAGGIFLYLLQKQKVKA